jgi:sec-independent protein translocase protein TatA
MFLGGIDHAPELIILLIITLVIFGPKKLPDLGRGLGQGIREFRRASSGEPENTDKATPTGSPISAGTPEVRAPVKGRTTVTEVPLSPE